MKHLMFALGIAAAVVLVGSDSVNASPWHAAGVFVGIPSLIRSVVKPGIRVQGCNKAFAQLSQDSAGDAAPEIPKAPAKSQNVRW